MNADESRMFGMTLERANAMLKAMGQPPLTEGMLTAMVASGVMHVSDETRRAQEQQQRFMVLSERQKSRVRAYMHEGLSFDQAYNAALRTDPVHVAAPVRLASINLPTPNVPRGRRLTRRQRRKA